MYDNPPYLNIIRMEISFNSFYELRQILSFYYENNIYKINIPCKNSLKKEFLLNSIEISKQEFPGIDIIPHFSIVHEFRRNRYNTLNSLIGFIKSVRELGCNEILLVSGSQKRATLDSLGALNFLKDDTFFSKTDFSIGVVFNPYLPRLLFEKETIKLEEKLNSGIVKSIWIQFGTDYNLLENRINILKKIIYSANKFNNNKSNIILFGSFFIPSKQFLARFKYRPWKGVYCSDQFLDSVDFANNLVMNLLMIYKKYNILPLNETCVKNKSDLHLLRRLFNQ